MKNIFRSTLNGQGIDNVAERFMSAAPSDKESRKNVLRSRIFMEEAMARYQREFGEETELIFSLLPVCFRTRVSPFTILRKNLPAALIGLTTASSASSIRWSLPTAAWGVWITKSFGKSPLPGRRPHFLNKQPYYSYEDHSYTNCRTGLPNGIRI